MTTDLHLRPPSLADGAAVAQLVRDAGELEPNTTYAYLLLCSHFASTCVVAEERGELLGVLLGYRMPDDQKRLFVWQVGVRPSARGRGVAKQMLGHLIDRPKLQDVATLEQTIAPSNAASLGLFSSFAKSRGLELTSSRGFLASDFGSHPHEEEHLVRIVLRNPAHG
jgi:L-2,4-diaminobutyric acid acetyltransferase